MKRREKEGMSASQGECLIEAEEKIGWECRHYSRKSSWQGRRNATKSRSSQGNVKIEGKKGVEEDRTRKIY